MTTETSVRFLEIIDIMIVDSALLFECGGTEASELFVIPNSTGHIILFVWCYQPIKLGIILSRLTGPVKLQVYCYPTGRAGDSQF